MSEQMEYTYKLFKGADDIIYVSVQPLMEDIKKSIEKMMDIDISELSVDNKQIFDLKILGLKTVYEFLGALQTEQFLKDKQQELKGNLPINTDSDYVPICSQKVH